VTGSRIDFAIGQRCSSEAKFEELHLSNPVLLSSRVTFNPIPLHYSSSPATYVSCRISKPGGAVHFSFANQAGAENLTSKSQQAARREVEL